jgi:dipeptidyl aminopeptidase/acylaminoacyl peptidase
MYIFRALTILIIIFSFFDSISQSKIQLDHSVYNSWKSVDNSSISNDGKLVVYEINPQEGDGNLYIYNVESGRVDSISRGYKPVISNTSEVVVFRIKPQFDTVRAAKLKKVKKDKLPKDSIGVFVISTGQVRKYKKLESFKVPVDGSDWIAFVLKDEKKAKDSITVDSLKTKEKPKKKKKGNQLVIMNPVTGDSVSFSNVTKYSFSKNGKLCSFIRIISDSIDSIQIFSYDIPAREKILLFENPGYSENIESDNQGNQIAFTYSSDTIKEKAFRLYYYYFPKRNIKLVSGNDFSKLKPGWSVSSNGKIFFNDSGKELYFGTAPKPNIVPKDTLTEDEKVSVDIWNWQDIRLQPQQLKELEKDKKRSYVAVYFPKNNKIAQLADLKVRTVKIDDKSSDYYSLGYDNQPYQRMASWEASRYKDVYLVNRKTGNKKLILSKVASSVLLSPDQKYVAWYSIADSSWNSYSIKDNRSVNFTSKIRVNFYNEKNDIPNEARPYGFAGWTKAGNPVVYDAFDLWQFDPTGSNAAVSITGKTGRENKIRYRYVKLDKDLRILPGKLLLDAFNTVNKDNGFYTVEPGKKETPHRLIMERFDFSNPIKARKAEKLIWSKQAFIEFPDLYISDSHFKLIEQISSANPQQDRYKWGDVKLVNWISFNGDSMQGLLYTPENLNPDRKYPMLVYFYEKYSDQLHRYYTPKPIRSVINFSYYVSNNYIVFIPDINYTNGYPGQSAFDCIVSGTQAMCDEYKFIDRDRLGIQGQSWGGYQVAYLITQTNMYRAAMAGAPVSNMTSAYGGIRWGSGMSRAFQYEQTQSRIGGNLWDKLPLYMLNSPLFSVDRIETPLLIMHNDKDGAVPWYQGIELFNAMRRLDKPVWMLVYNGAPHNLKRRADCKDLTIRMQQYFDYYLKDKSMPVWMKTGIPALKKGKSFGFEME